MAKGCLSFICYSILIGAFFYMTSGEADKKDEENTTASYVYDPETGNYEPRVVENKRKGKTKYHLDSPDDVTETSLYYPEREIDSLAHRPLATGERSKDWYHGYDLGSSAGSKDSELHKPYESYCWGGFGKGQAVADFKLGYWIGYRRYNPTIPLLSNDEVKARVAKEKEEIRLLIEKQREREKKRKEAAANGYYDGYSAGYEDGYYDGTDDGYGYSSSSREGRGSSSSSRRGSRHEKENKKGDTRKCPWRG